MGASLRAAAAAEEPPRKRQRSSEVVLNVGGVRHSTSRESLLKCAYFRALLSGDFADPPDEIFVDRDGELFRHILKYMRTGRRPSETILQNHKRDLIAEADFFGFDAFRCMLDGSTDPFQLLPRDRQMLADEEECAHFFESPLLSDLELRDWERRLLVPVFAQRPSFEPREPDELQVPLLRPHRSAAEPPRLTAADAEDFRGRLADLIEPIIGDGSSSSDSGPRRRGHLLEDLEGIGGVVIAGGSVLAALTGGTASDVDIFCVGGDAADAEVRLRQILLAVKRRHRARYASLGACMKVVRTVHAVTADRDERAPPLQVMLALYRSPLEVILQFDIDVCAFLYDVSRREVLCLPRARRALVHRTNIANTSMRSPTYERRLEKYTKRGFAVGVPGLDEDAVDPALFAGSYLFLRREDLLLELGERTHQTKAVCSEYTRAGSQLLSGQQQAASIVRGLRRLIVLDRIRQGLAHDASASVSGARRCSNPRGKSNSPLLVSHGDVNHRSAQLQLVSALEYKSDEQEIDSSDARTIIERIRERADLSSRLRPAGEPWVEDLGDQAAQETWPSSRRWRDWAQKRKAQGQPIFFVSGMTRWATDDLSDTSLEPVFDAGPTLEAEPGAPGEIPRMMRFERAEASTAAFFGRYGHAQYHRAHGDWFAGVYA